MIESFPHEAVPDGNVAAPHHYYYLALAALGAVLTVWDDYRTREPIIAAGGLVVGLFAFRFMWPITGYHALGAALAVAGPFVTVLAVLNPVGAWAKPASKGGYSARTGVVVVALAFGALDDAIEHALDVTTPLDWLFHVAGIQGSFVIVVVFTVAAAIAVSIDWGRVGGGGSDVD